MSNAFFTYIARRYYFAIYLIETNSIAAKSNSHTRRRRNTQPPATRLAARFRHMPDEAEHRTKKITLSIHQFMAFITAARFLAESEFVRVPFKPHLKLA